MEAGEGRATMEEEEEEEAMRKGGSAEGCQSRKELFSDTDPGSNNDLVIAHGFWYSAVRDNSVVITLRYSKLMESVSAYPFGAQGSELGRPDFRCDPESAGLTAALSGEALGGAAREESSLQDRLSVVPVPACPCPFPCRVSALSSPVPAPIPAPAASPAPAPPPAPAPQPTLPLPLTSFCPCTVCSHCAFRSAHWGGEPGFPRGEEPDEVEGGEEREDAGATNGERSGQMMHGPTDRKDAFRKLDPDEEAIRSSRGKIESRQQRSCGTGPTAGTALRLCTCVRKSDMSDSEQQ
eukprot:373376-Hanusia_phi.AAC.1